MSLVAIDLAKNHMEICGGFFPPKDKTLWTRLIHLDIYLPIKNLSTLHNFINAFLCQ